MTSNRFKKSIEKLETAAENQPKPLKPSADRVAPTKNPEDTPLPFMESMKPQIAASDNLGDIPLTKRLGRDTTVYLTNEVLDAVSQIAKQRGGSKSKVIDKALRQVLAIG